MSLQTRHQTGVGFALIVSAGLMLLLLSRGEPAYGVFGGLGLAVGFVMQRSRFCFTAAFRDLFMVKSGRNMKGVIIGMAIATVGFGSIMANLLPNPALGAVAPEAHVNPVGLHLLLGGILFGIGMVAAGGCTSGSLYRMGEGYAASWVAFTVSWPGSASPAIPGTGGGRPPSALPRLSGYPQRWATVAQR